jgi:hypothetical protein
MDVLKIKGKEVVLNTNLTIKELKEICDYCEIRYYGNKISVIIVLYYLYLLLLCNNNFL